MLKFVWNQLKTLEKWGFEPCGAYADPTLRLTNRRKMQKTKKLRLVSLQPWTNCSRFRLFTNCTPLNPTICFILPDRDITKIAETVLVSAICLILPFGFVTPERLELSTQWLRVICSTNWATKSFHFAIVTFSNHRLFLDCGCKDRGFIFPRKLFDYFFS